MIGSTQCRSARWKSVRIDMRYRLEKFASTLQQALGEILSRESLNPGFKRISVTDVQPAPDLKRATVFIACPLENSANVLEQLRRSSGFIKKQLALKMILRHMPELDFTRDTAPELEQKINSLQQEENHESTDR
jgi:ribosome-binding factor A